MNTKIPFILFFMILAVVSYSVTITVKQDGSGDYTQIQEAVDNASNGDLILVYPGIYYENISIADKNITLASLEYTTNDENYISQTIIDGNMNDSVIFLGGSPANISIIGFTMQNGKGHYFDPVIGNLGGGIFVASGYNLTINNSIITKNIANLGGGICTECNTLSLENVTIKENKANTGGGIFDGYHTNFIFSSTNRCNIYNNNAGSGRDLFACGDSNNIHVIVDTFTVMNPDSYYACHLNENAHFTFDIEHSFIEPIDSDLYVSPNGDDNNSGLTENEPLQTISWAMQKIASNPDNPHTIHLSSGTYSQTLNNQFFPIGFKSYITLEGDENDRPTLVYSDTLITAIIITIQKNNNITLKNINIKSQSYNNHDYLIGIARSDYISLKNFTIKDSDLDSYCAFLISICDNVILENITITGMTIPKV